MSSFVKLLHCVTEMGTGIVMPSLATNVFISVFIYHTEILTKVYDCHRPKTTTAMDQTLQQLWTKDFNSCWLGTKVFYYLIQ